MSNEIRFYRAVGEHGYLSNLWPCKIVFESRWFPDSERAYQFGKPSDHDVAEWIVMAPSASLCAQIAHALLPWQVSKDWSARKVDRMRAVLQAKFEQNIDLAANLASTGDAQLIEESKTDAFWGTGKKGNGKNMLGVLLMELREKFQGDEAEQVCRERNERAELKGA